MISIRRFRPLLVAAAALSVADAALGQGQGRPAFPPGLHDRTLPPGRPFSPPDNFNPPGRAGFPGSGDIDDVASRLAQILDDDRFPAPDLLTQAVDAYNYLVLSVARLGGRAPAALVAARQILPPALGLPEASEPGSAFRVASVDASPMSDPGAWALLPGGTTAVVQFARPRWTMPGMSAATPIGFGAEWGTVWAGASYQPHVRYGDGEDGAVGVGFGLGDADRWVGLQVGVISFSTVNSGFGTRVGIDLQLHRRFGGLWGVAVGLESVGADWQVSRDSGKNLYVVGSRWIQLRSDPDEPFGTAMVSLGVGSGRFQREADFYDRADGVGVFGSFGVRVLEPISFIAEWTGQDLMLGSSITPFRSRDVALTAGFTEVTGAAGDGARFTVGGSVGFRFR